MQDPSEILVGRGARTAALLMLPTTQAVGTPGLRWGLLDSGFWNPYDMISIIRISHYRRKFIRGVHNIQNLIREHLPVFIPHHPVLDRDLAVPPAVTSTVNR